MICEECGKETSVLAIRKQYFLIFFWYPVRLCQECDYKKIFKEE